MNKLVALAIAMALGGCMADGFEAEHDDVASQVSAVEEAPAPTDENMMNQAWNRCWNGCEFVMGCQGTICRIQHGIGDGRDRCDGDVIANERDCVDQCTRRYGGDDGGPPL